MRPGLEAPHHTLDRRLDPIEDRLRVETDEERQREERHHDQHLATVGVGHLGVLTLGNTGEHPLEHPEHVDRAEDHTGRGDDAPPTMHGEGSQQRKELAHEPGERREADPGEHRDQEHRGELGRRLPDAPELVDLAGVATFVEHADHEEQRAGGERMTDHGEGRTVEAEDRDREDPEQDEAHVRDRRIRDHPLRVLLHRRDDGAVDDPDHGQGEEERGEVGRGAREQLEAEAQHAVRTHLEDDAGQHHRAGRRRFGVHVRQPGVERDERRLDGERGHEAEEQPVLGGGRHAAGGPGGQDAVVEGQRARVRLVQERKHQDRCEEERRAGRGVDEELGGGVLAVRAAPSRDEEVHRDQHRFPEDEETDEVEAEEDAENCTFEQQEPEDVGLGSVLDLRRGEQSDREQQCRGHDHEEAEAVDADDVTDAKRVEPPVVFEVLEPAEVRAELPQQQQRETEGGHRHHEADRARQLGTTRRGEEHEQRTKDRRDDDRRENRIPAH